MWDISLGSILLTCKTAHLEKCSFYSSFASQSAVTSTSLHHRTLCILFFFKDVPDVWNFSILHHWMSPRSLLHTHILNLCVVRGGISGASLPAHSLRTKWLDEGDYAKLGKELRRGQHGRSEREGGKVCSADCFTYAHSRVWTGIVVEYSLTLAMSFSE